jgi:hypothetical protein
VSTPSVDFQVNTTPVRDIEYSFTRILESSFTRFWQVVVYSLLVCFPLGAYSSYSHTQILVHSPLEKLSFICLLVYSLTGLLGSCTPPWRSTHSARFPTECISAARWLYIAGILPFIIASMFMFHPLIHPQLQSYPQCSTLRILILVFHSRYSSAVQASKSTPLVLDPSTTAELPCEASQTSRATLGVSLPAATFSTIDGRPFFSTLLVEGKFSESATLVVDCYYIPSLGKNNMKTLYASAPSATARLSCKAGVST